jgi:hypothetical protein
MHKPLLVFAFCFFVYNSLGQQVADPNFDARVAKPAYIKNGPKILFDEAHNNFHTMPGVNTNPSSAAGRAQGIAMTLGKGRVVVLGEAAMLSAQLAGPNKMAFGMNLSGIDNWL